MATLTTTAPAHGDWQARLDPSRPFRPILDPIPDLDDSHIEITYDDPVDNWLQDILRRILATTLTINLARWCPDPENRCIIASDVGLFANPGVPGRAPDIFISLGVMRHLGDEKKNETYFFWEYGKPPDFVLEIVSNKKGGERTTRKKEYEQMGVPYYVVFDPKRKLIKKGPELESYELTPKGYRKMKKAWFPMLNLGLTVWSGYMEGYQEVEKGKVANWLRFYDKDELLPIAEEAMQQVEDVRERAKVEKERADFYAEKLRKLGIDPDAPE